MKRVPLILLFALLPLSTIVAQDTLRLPELYRSAIEHDPRISQRGLQQGITELQLKNLSVEHLPKVTAGVEAIYQSEVPEIALNFPDVTIPSPPHDRLAATVDVEQLIYDGGIISRRERVEEAQLVVDQAQVGVALYTLRAEVDEAFFTAYLLQEKIGELRLTVEDLEARLKVIRTGLQAGTVLPGDTATLRAELLRVRLTIEEMEANRRSAVRMIGELTGVERSLGDILLLPDLSDRVAVVREELEEKDGSEHLQLHPQYNLFDAQYERLRSEGELQGKSELPRISAFGQVGFGRPGLSQFTDDFHPYWLAGVRLRWSPFNWGSAERKREVIGLRQKILQSEEAAFTNRLRRRVINDLETIDRIGSTVKTDEEIISLREEVERQARTRLNERAITPDAYVNVRTDLQEARLARGRHQVELVRAQVQLLTTIGIELQ